MRIQIQYDAQLIEINRFTFNILFGFLCKVENFDGCICPL
jgi:hypothetical protein